MKNLKNKKTFRKTQKYTDNPEFKDQIPGGPSAEGTARIGLSEKALSRLPKSSYSIKADPYTGLLPVSTPYNIIGKFLKSVGGNYQGDSNIDGGNLQQYANSWATKFLRYFDSFRMKLKVNYRYLPISNSKVGSRLVDEMRKSLSEAISMLNATTYTTLAINNFIVATDMNLGSATYDTVRHNGKELKVYKGKQDVMYAISIFYQIYLQEVLSIMNWHNSFRMKQGTAIRSAWGREVPNLNAFFGLMNKKAFTSLLDSINLSFEGEYIDKSFMEQMNYLTYVPSRRSNSITDPVLEIQASFNAPEVFNIYVVDNDGEVLGGYDNPYFTLEDLVEEGSTESFFTSCENLKDLLSYESTMKWARAVYTDVDNTDYEITTTSANKRYNDIVKLFDKIIYSMMKFKPNFADFRECLDIMARTGSIQWYKGFRPAVITDTDGELFHNLIVDDIYKMVMSGNNKLSFNDRTKRWETYSQWNLYTGVPEYDMRQGGAFITFSSKLFDDSADTDSTIQYLPVMFDPDPSATKVYIEGVARDGAVCYLTYTVEKINDNKVLSRLAPLVSQNNLEIRIPTLTYSLNDKLTKDHRSTLYKTLGQIFGIAKIIDSASTSDYVCDPDIIAIYQVEITDITNEAITYARANAPFRGTTSGDGLIGFLGMAKSAN